VVRGCPSPAAKSQANTGGRRVVDSGFGSLVATPLRIVVGYPRGRVVDRGHGRDCAGPVRQFLRTAVESRSLVLASLWNRAGRRSRPTHSSRSCGSCRTIAGQQGAPARAEHRGHRPHRSGVTAQRPACRHPGHQVPQPHRPILAGASQPGAPARGGNRCGGVRRGGPRSTRRPRPVRRPGPWAGSAVARPPTARRAPR